MNKETESTVTLPVKDFLRLYELEKSLSGFDLNKDMVYFNSNYGNGIKVLNPDEAMKELSTKYDALSQKYEGAFIYKGKLISGINAVEILKSLSEKWWFKLFGL